MSKIEHFLASSKAALNESELARRIQLASGDYADEEKGKPSLLKFMGEADLLIEPARRLVRQFEVPKARVPQTVILFPGFGHGPSRMQYMADRLEEAGHTVKHWGQGRNWGVAEATLDALEERLADVCNQTGGPVALVGWSLGGLYARELAKLHPEQITKVITMGSPFSGSRRSNNIWRLYSVITGESVDQPAIQTDASEKPDVETVAFWSPNDGAIGPRSAAGKPGERDRAVALRCTHSGFTYDPNAIVAVVNELDRHTR
ncbi:MAG: alpha/beta fold hydrolase [Erythrobacter sp.]|uniref:esterase/lipase family protein n=1 Tax=Erythrobacter sp. TaxID=1042 RepID=UPI003267ED0F